MLIGGLQKLTLIDYPERVACTVFLIGCNFRCGYCHNPELVLGNGTRVSETLFFNFLKERRGLLVGVVISGGEPTIHKELPEFIKKIKKLGYLVKLDTNGSNPEMLRKLIDENLLDYVAMDIKAPLGLKFQIKNSKPEISKYEKVVGVKVDIEKIKKSIELIKNSGIDYASERSVKMRRSLIDYEFRTTVVPSIHTKEVLIQIAKEISRAKRYYLQNFRSEKTIDQKFVKIKPYSDKELLKIQKAIVQFFDTCEIR